MRHCQYLFFCAAIAFFATSCSVSRTTSDASSNGRKPRLADRIDHERTDLERSAVTTAPVVAVPERIGIMASPTIPVSAALVERHLPTGASEAMEVVASVAPIAPERVPGRSVGLRAVSLIHRTIGAAPMPSAAEGGGGTNVWAIVGFVCSFFVPLLGIIFSVIALSQIKRTGEKGHGLALAGLIISIVTMLIVISLLA